MARGSPASTAKSPGRIRNSAQYACVLAWICLGLMYAALYIFGHIYLPRESPQPNWFALLGFYSVLLQAFTAVLGLFVLLGAIIRHPMKWLMLCVRRDKVAPFPSTCCTRAIKRCAIAVICSAVAMSVFLSALYVFANDLFAYLNSEIDGTGLPDPWGFLTFQFTLGTLAMFWVFLPTLTWWHLRNAKTADGTV
jgi:Na+-driven multidrug efflux pump